MAEITLYDISVASYKRGTTVLLNLLQKAKEHPDSSTFPEARLYPDMLPLTFQVQSTALTVTKSLNKLLDAEIKDLPELQGSMDQLIEHAEKTLHLLQGIERMQLQGREAASVKMPGGPVNGKEFILRFALPNFFFHLQTVYAILRMKGLQIGKDDYLGPFNTADEA